MGASFLNSVVFYGIAGLLIMSATGVVTFQRVFHSALALISALSLVAALFLLMGADFLGAAQVLVYVGGIMIIMLFVVMLSQQPMTERQINDQWLAGLFLGVIVAAALVISFRGVVGSLSLSSQEMAPTSAPLGRLLLGEMILPFEVVSLVLLAALVGAVIFGQDKLDGQV